MRKIIKSAKFPTSNYFSQAILCHNEYTMELSGQIGINPETENLVEGVEEQTKQIMENIADILKEVTWNHSNIIKARIFLKDMQDYAKVNNIYGSYFKSDPPARIALAVKELPLGALIEIECTASGEEI